MIGLLQRVREASVHVDGVCVGRIDRGLLVLVGVQREDDVGKAYRMLERLLGYRVFADEGGRMNLGLRDLGPEMGGLLLVPQFTLAADTRSGMRPSFTTAAPPAAARSIFEVLLRKAQDTWPSTSSGVFGADMQVSLINDGPVTFWLEV